MYTHGLQDVIRKVGFSLLDMRNYLAEKGYDAQGFRADLDTVARIGLPAIILITTGTYHHFVVLRGMERKRVFVADPYHDNPMAEGRTLDASVGRVINSILLVIVTYDANLLVISPKPITV